MSRQDKATTEKFTRTLRELVKRPENKVCADCKRNDPRWASWNIGVFLCIRCSGIHRGMGTHISKVKSVDLDVWTPEQMESITKWGNRLANLYWEAHLKQGHIPPEHKMESFIRSKYESRRWALEGPTPKDPSVLDNGTASHSAEAAPPPVSAPTTTTTATTTTTTTTRQSQPHQLLSSNYTNRSAPTAQQPAAQITPAPAAPSAPANDLFSLDFHSPPPQSAAPPPVQRKDMKQDILSLFSAAPGPPPVANPYWGTPAAPAAPTSMMGGNGVGMWGASSGWSQQQQQPPIPVQPNVWGSPTAVPQQQQQQQMQNLFNTNAVWGAPTGPTPPTASAPDPFGAFSTSTPQQQQPAKDDVFGDIWGNFK